MHLRSFGKGAELKNTTKNPLLYLAWRRVSGGFFQTKHSVYALAFNCLHIANCKYNAQYAFQSYTEII